MNNIISMFMTFLPAFIIGLILGAIFFIGLWWTVRRIASDRHPAMLVLVSFLLRTTVVLLGLYWSLEPDDPHAWQTVLVTVAGFSIARLMVTGFTNRMVLQDTQKSLNKNKELADAP